MGIKERTKRHKETLRQNILNAARTLLFSKGYADFSMRRLAERIEYTPTTIYLHFKDKREILFHLREEVYGLVTDLLETAAASEKNPARRVRAVIRAFVDFGLSDPDRYRLAFGENASAELKPITFLQEGTKGLHAYETVRKMVQDMGKKKSKETEDLDCLTQVLWANTHGLITFLNYHSDFPWVDRDKLINLSIDMTIKGLGL